MDVALAQLKQYKLIVAGLNVDEFSRSKLGIRLGRRYCKSGLKALESLNALSGFWPIFE